MNLSDFDLENICIRKLFCVVFLCFFFSKIFNIILIVDIGFCEIFFLYCLLLVFMKYFLVDLF